MLLKNKIAFQKTHICHSPQFLYTLDTKALPTWIFFLSWQVLYDGWRNYEEVQYCVWSDKGSLAENTDILPLGRLILGLGKVQFPVQSIWFIFFSTGLQE